MLVLGICNPQGEHDNYNGLYFKDTELKDIVSKNRLHGLPIRTEHGTGDVGKILSTYMRDDGALQCLFELDGIDLEHKIAQGFVRDGVALELSMGYTVDVKQTSGNTLRAGDKNTIEVSLVKKGARDGCHILAFQDPNTTTRIRNSVCKQADEADEPTQHPNANCVDPKDSERFFEGFL